mmetsp:Transcript_73348/g.153106  ORF Transcript_73348/g.153106 Transcript_73348/m.153106 type:complete len:210 (-) Transcript_73348:217-846(-)
MRVFVVLCKFLHLLLFLVIERHHLLLRLFVHCRLPLWRPCPRLLQLRDDLRLVVLPEVVAQLLVLLLLHLLPRPPEFCRVIKSLHGATVNIPLALENQVDVIPFRETLRKRNHNRSPQSIQTLLEVVLSDLLVALHVLLRVSHLLRVAHLSVENFRKLRLRSLSRPPACGIHAVVRSAGNCVVDKISIIVGGVGVNTLLIRLLGGPVER